MRKIREKGNGIGVCGQLRRKEERGKVLFFFFFFLQLSLFLKEETCLICQRKEKKSHPVTWRNGEKKKTRSRMRWRTSRIYSFFTKIRNWIV